MQEEAREVYTNPVTQTSHTRPIEAPNRTLHLPLGLKQVVDQLPTTLETIPTACLVRYLRIWTETLAGMVAGSYDWAALGVTFTKLLLTCSKQGEDRTKEVELRLWYIEEGRVE